MDTLLNLNSANSILEMYIIAPLVIPFLAIALSDWLEQADSGEAEPRPIGLVPAKHSRLGRSMNAVPVTQSNGTERGSIGVCSLR